MLKFNSNVKTKPKIYINIGATLDIPTSNIITGSKGESIINGGLGQITGIVGHGNNYKSTMMHYMMLSAADKVKATHDTAMTTYDTEINISIDRLQGLASNFKNLPEDPIHGEDNIWDITDKTIESADEWVMKINEYSNNKAKSKNLVVEFNAFKDPYEKKPLKMLLPTFAEIDSLSEFEAASTVEMLSKNLDDSATNTYAMKQGGFKSKFLGQLPKTASTGNIYFFLTAQIGGVINMETGPMAKYNQPTKKLQYLKSGDAIKGVSGKFSYLSNAAWYAHTAVLLKNQSTKLPEYPISSDDSLETDLNIVKLTQMRSKNGPSGYTLEIIVSQVEGVQPTLTEFHNIKTNGKFGIEGNDRSYNIVLLPDVKLSRTTVRSKINNDPILRRAINIMSELLQLKKFQSNFLRDLLCTPEELYNDIIAMGYKWDKLLNTRGYWLIDNYSKDQLPYLSTIDLLKMRKGLYTPYWYKVEDND